ncbi:Trans-2,3-dihydro-3-hydroxyanthranilate isomerase [Caulifigura coniformis]|uniref:Trans-2,3-dihydro-3-hydroxyanthranilate isomerase n=1 Tax=Caulifigura coniformis TaxID=2527983 RepID=A0A517SBJ9_9PLAN|nr:PhzF family phenazine biosynthesis protein [Caulifigura coniformis]QDT53521.1 Trans-2,3-dihydro-3-hydroxyanthranilate isomerase [Caulifigura coniformis]
MPLTPCFQIDAFADRPFTGNPAAVCLLDRDVDDAWMQNVAAEMNLAETAFVRPREDGYSLRWFTPEVEVDLCGHATLASAHALWTEAAVPSDRALRFHTRSGLLTCVRRGEQITMDFPAVLSEQVSPRPELLEALGTTAEWAGRSQWDDLVLLRDAAALAVLRPDMRRLREVTTRGVIVTAPSDDPRIDFVSRFFAPRVGIDEDPVTGSAHCCLGPFWAARLGKTDLTGYQASRRGGTVGVCVDGDRVELSGSAVTVLRGELL